MDVIRFERKTKLRHLFTRNTFFLLEKRLISYKIRIGNNFYLIVPLNVFLIFLLETSKTLPSHPPRSTSIVHFGRVQMNLP